MEQAVDGVRQASRRNRPDLWGMKSGAAGSGSA